MAPMFRRHDRSDGGGVVISANGLKWFAAALTCTAISWGVISAAVRKNDKLETAVTRAEFVLHAQGESLAIRRIDTALARMSFELSNFAKSQIALNCYTAGYPVGFCDDVPRGTPRRSRNQSP